MVSVDESSVSGMPGFVKVVRERNYVAVVFQREEQAIAAARRLKVNWRKPATAPFPASEELFTLCAAPSRRRARIRTSPEISSRRSQARPHASRPSTKCRSRATPPSVPRTLLADPSNGQMTIYSNDMKSYGLRNGVAEFLNIPRDRVRVIWMQGPQAYGRTAADDAGFEAAYLAQQLGRPVRVQWSRDEETAWDTKGPAYVMRMRGGLDAQGNLVALDYEARAADYCHLGYNEHDTVLIAQLTGRRRHNARRWWSRLAVGHVRGAQPAHGGPRGLAAARVGNAAAGQATCEIQTDRRLRLPASRSSTSSLPQRKPIRSNSVCGFCRRARATTVASSGRARSRSSRRRPKRSSGMRGRRLRHAPQARSSGAAVSHTPIAIRPSSPTLPKSR